jgi:hypothetical protein
MTNSTPSKSITIVPNDNVVIETPLANYAPLLLVPLAAAVTHHYSKKQMRKMKRKMLWQMLSSKMFKGKGKLSTFWLVLLYCSPLIIVLFLFNWVMGLILLGSLLIAMLYASTQKK